MSEAEVREGEDEKERAVRMRWNHQYIINSTLKGEHLFLSGGALRLNWSAVLSKAFSETPDNAEIYLLGSHVSTTDAAIRRWEHNSDKDKAGYVDLAYKLKLDGGAILDFSAGGMYRDKKRDSFFNEYTINSATGSKNPQYINKDWFNFDEIQFVPRHYGNKGEHLKNERTEKISLGFVLLMNT